MQSLTAQTRARTLRERLSTDQNGSTSVRSTGRLAGDLNPVHRPAGVKAYLEGDYFDELRTTQTNMNDDFCDNDYDLDMSDHADELPITSPAAARLFGGIGGYQIYGREQRGSMTKGTVTFSDIDSRLYEATPFKEVASPIDSTRPVLPQLFGLGGQTESTQAQTEMKRGEIEKDSPSSSLWRATSCSS